jgi:hypothetical protein
VSPRAHQRAIRASGDDTLRIRAYDVVRRLDWPAEYNARALGNAFLDTWHGNEAEWSSSLPDLLVPTRTPSRRRISRRPPYSSAKWWAAFAKSVPPPTSSPTWPMRQRGSPIGEGRQVQYSQVQYSQVQYSQVQYKGDQAEVRSRRLSHWSRNLRASNM